MLYRTSWSPPPHTALPEREVPGTFFWAWSWVSTELKGPLLLPPRLTGEIVVVCGGHWALGQLLINICHLYFVPLGQECLTSSPWAACGRQGVKLWPSVSSLAAVPLITLAGFIL